MINILTVSQSLGPKGMDKMVCKLQLFTEAWLIQLRFKTEKARPSSPTTVPPC